MDQDCTNWQSQFMHNPPLTFCVGGTCSQCRTNADCDTADPICDSMSKLCRTCTADSDCTSGICRKPGDYPAMPPVANLVTGQCVDPSNVAYVNNNAVVCSDSGMGTQMQPYCKVSTAISANKPYINVAASMTSYGSLTLNNATQSFVIVGAGRDSNPSTQFGQVTLSAGTLVLSELQILGPVVTGAVVCSGGGSSIYLLNTIVSNSSGRGIDASANCGQVTVDHTHVDCGGGAKYGIIAGALNPPNTTYLIVNSLVTNCGNSGGELYGVELETTATGYFGFNTLTSNYKGLACSVGQQSAVNSIVAGNVSAQIDGGCGVSGNTTNVVTDSSKVQFIPGSNPPMLNTSSAVNQMNIVGTGSPPPANVSVATDYFGTPRPSSMGQYDIGYQQISQ
jgi:hypothetical protein